MTRGQRVAAMLAVAIGVPLLALAVSLAHDARCPTASAQPEGLPAMRAVVARCYGPPDVLQLETVPRPVVADDAVLVKVRAASLNPLDWHFMRGEPYVMRLLSGFGRPKDARVGVDFAGTVEAVGRKVTRFRPGDEVFGGANGALGEYVVVRESRAIAAKPANLGFAEAAAVPIAAVTALQALREVARVEPGQRVLVNGASGGVGTFAVQIAKALGAEVTGVTSTRNVELVRALGADRVIDYTREDFTRGTVRYDVVVDNVGNHPLLAYRRALRDTGVLVMVGGPSVEPWLGPLSRTLRAAALAPFVSQRYETLFATLDQADLETVRRMMVAGQVRPVIDRRYRLDQVRAAMTYLELGHARGKLAVLFE